MSGNPLDDARELLRAAVRLSGQSKLERGRPDRPAIQPLSEARGLLRQLAQTDSQNPEVWRLLSEAEECLLGYRAAVEAIEQAIKLCPTPEKQDQKNLARLREYARKWLPLTLSFTQLRKLRDALQAAGVADAGGEATLRHTRAWLKANGYPRPAEVLKALASRGATSDVEVLQYTLSLD